MAYNKKLSNEKKSKKFIISGVQAYISGADEFSDKIVEQINKVLNSMPFNRFSIPLNAYREDVLPNENGNNKCLTIGFIKKYNNEEGTFDVVIFDTFKSAIQKFENTCIEINFGSYNGELSKINKLILMDAGSIEEVTVDNDAETVDAE